MDLPVSADDLTAAWLTEALAPSTGGATVTAVEATPIGTGQVAQTRRLVLTWDPPGAGPDVLVAKVPTTDPTSLNAARTMRNYAVEVSFYRDLLPTVDVCTPRCHFADHDPETDAFALVMDDQAPAQQGDQMAGCAVDEAAAAVDELVALHAPRWGDDSLSELQLSWLNTGGAAGAMFAQLVSGLFPVFLERYDDRLTPELRTAVELLGEHLVTYLGERPGPRSLAHNDFRLDNLLIGGPRIAVVDWQTVSYGYALADLSYFMGGSLLPDDRVANEEALVRQYHEGLTARGVDLSWDSCWESYRRYAFDGLLMAVTASVGVERTERGDVMFMTMAERSAQHAADLETAALIGA
jgi:hypothetical protein